MYIWHVFSRIYAANKRNFVMSNINFGNLKLNGLNHSQYK